MQFFIRDEEQKLAEQSTNMDDVDLIPSPVDGHLVVVAMKEGHHVCQRCGKGFNNAMPKLRGVEVRHGYARLLLHAQCEKTRPKITVFQNLHGMQVRRKITQVAQQTQAVADAAESRKQSLVP